MQKFAISLGETQNYSLVKQFLIKLLLKVRFSPEKSPGTLSKNYVWVCTMVWRFSVVWWSQQDTIPSTDGPADLDSDMFE